MKATITLTRRESVQLGTLASGDLFTGVFGQQAVLTPVHHDVIRGPQIAYAIEDAERVPCVVVAVASFDTIAAGTIICLPRDMPVHRVRAVEPVSFVDGADWG